MTKKKRLRREPQATEVIGFRATREEIRAVMAYVQKALPNMIVSKHTAFRRAALDRIEIVAGDEGKDPYEDPKND